jgi:hypothetical protein
MSNPLNVGSGIKVSDASVLNPQSQGPASLENPSQMATGHTVTRYRAPAKDTAPEITPSQMMRDGLTPDFIRKSHFNDRFSEIVEQRYIDGSSSGKNLIVNVAIAPAVFTDFVGAGSASAVNFLVSGLLGLFINDSWARTAGNVVALVIRLAVTAGVGVVSYGVTIAATTFVLALYLVKLLLKDGLYDTVLVKGLIENALIPLARLMARCDKIEAQAAMIVAGRTLEQIKSIAERQGVDLATILSDALKGAVSSKAENTLEEDAGLEADRIRALIADLEKGVGEIALSPEQAAALERGDMSETRVFVNV